jgi:DNA-binding SARP family transcriptional activator
VDAARYAMSALTDRPGGDRQPTARPVGPLGALVCIADYARGRLSALAEPSPARWSEGVEWPWRIAALRARGQTTEALAQYELASAAAWQSSAIVMVAAPELLMDAGRWAEAEAVIERGGALALQAGSPALLGLHRIHEAKLALRRRRDPEGALAALARPECTRAVERFSYMRELADTWAGLALLLAGRDRDALARLRGAVDAMVAGDRILELPFAGVFLSEAEWRAGDDEAADAAAERALDAARRQGSNHLLLQALAFFPAVVSRRVDVAQEWGEIGRALIAQGAAGAAQASITVRLLEFGRRAIVVEGEEVKPKIAKSYELLSFLLATPGGECTRDQLLEALFDARRDDSARAYLRQAIRWLREMLPEGAFAAEGQVVRLGAGVAVTSESVELERLLAEAARLQGAERLEATLKALAIADKGPFLPGNRGGWADEREQRLADAVTEARYHAAVLAFGDGRYEESRALTRAVLEQEPLREPAWRLQMRIAQALGDSDAALRAFQNCERALREIGAEPSPSTLLLLSRARRN